MKRKSMNGCDTHVYVSKLHNELAAVWRTLSISVSGRVAFKFAVQSLPTVPFSLNTT